MTAIPTRVFDARHGRRQIDGRAWACIEKCRRRLGLDEVPLPIPVEDWIEGPLGITYGITDLSHLGDGVLGAAYVGCVTLAAGVLGMIQAGWPRKAGSGGWARFKEEADHASEDDT
ncbi:MAG: hypothetical protein KKB50_02840 [Planctomycetes bacterium]|nr:hypothetical protein [Planctomycetota bacterium]